MYVCIIYVCHTVLYRWCVTYMYMYPCMHMCNMNVTHIVYHILCILHVMCIIYNLIYVYINIRQIKVNLLWATRGWVWKSSHGWKTVGEEDTLPHFPAHPPSLPPRWTANEPPQPNPRTIWKNCRKEFINSLHKGWEPTVLALCSMLGPRQKGKSSFLQGLINYWGSRTRKG